MKEKMEAIAVLLMEKTEERIKKETILSKKTLEMISLSEKLFATLKTWGSCF